MGNQYCIELSETVLGQKVAPAKKQRQLQLLTPDDARASQRYSHLARGLGKPLSFYTLRVVDGSGNSSIISDRGFHLSGAPAAFSYGSKPYVRTAQYVLMSFRMIDCT